MNSVIWIARRLSGQLTVLVAVSAIVFVLTRVIPGDPIQTMLAAAQVSDPHIVATYRHEFHLDAPVPVQYVSWLWNVVHGNWGQSIVYGTPVTDLVLHAFLDSLLLSIVAAVLAVGVGVLLGALAAKLTVAHAWRPFRIAAALTPLMLVVIPSFVVALLLTSWFAVDLHWLPATGMHSPGAGSGLDLLRHIVLPAVALSVAPAGATARLARAALLEVMAEDHVRTARAKGLRESRVFVVHTLRNAVSPLATNTAILLASLVSSAVLVESVFAWPGLANLMVSSILARDYPVIEGGTIIVAATYIVLNLAVDLMYPLFDPRVRGSR